MRYLFRADASLQIGTGHIMRCLTLADALRDEGAECQFICREHPGNLIEYIQSKGYVTYRLPMCNQVDSDSTHSDWLGATQAQDGDSCVAILERQNPDWLVVDHYALDARWERQVASNCNHLMVIDDLADRPHFCDILLDQTFGRAHQDYLPWVPMSCKLLCGSNYALLRPEFARLREYSLRKRVYPQVKNLLINLGGVDRHNVTSTVLIALRESGLSNDSQLTVVMGTTSQWLYEVKKLLKDMPWPTRMLVGVNDMAQLMADSDLAIGAAGTTSWERCCLGLPTILIVLADNQYKIAQSLQQVGAAKILNLNSINTDQLNELLKPLIDDRVCLQQMSECAASLTDGFGVKQVIRQMAVL